MVRDGDDLPRTNPQRIERANEPVRTRDGGEESERPVLQRTERSAVSSAPADARRRRGNGDDVIGPREEELSRGAKIASGRQSATSPRSIRVHREERHRPLAVAPANVERPIEDEHVGSSIEIESEGAVDRRLTRRADHDGHTDIRERAGTDQRFVADLRQRVMQVDDPRCAWCCAVRVADERDTEPEGRELASARNRDAGLARPAQSRASDADERRLGGYGQRTDEPSRSERRGGGRERARQEATELAGFERSGGDSRQRHRRTLHKP